MCFAPWGTGPRAHFNPHLQSAEALAEGERFHVSLRCLTGTSANLHCLHTAQQLHLNTKNTLRCVTSSSSYSPALAARNNNKSIMNFKEHLCLQVAHRTPKTAPRSGLLPPLRHFQTHQITIHRRKNFTPISWVFSPPPLALWALQRAAMCPCCKRQRPVENHRPQAGRWPTRPHCFRSMCLCS